MVQLLEELPRLTQRQEGCLARIYKFFLEHRYYPTSREIAKGINVGNAANTHIAALVKKGYLMLRKGEPRNVRFTERGLEKLSFMGVATDKQKTIDQMELFEKEDRG